MRKISCILLLILLLTGCQADRSGFDRAMALRTSLLTSEQCEFDAIIDADFGDQTYCFTLHCQADSQGDLEFQVTAPETIAGIAGKISQGTGNLTFDDTVLAFPLLGDGILSPVSGSWILLQALRSGYVRVYGHDEMGYRVTVDDSYGEDALMLDIWLDEENKPVRGEIYQENRRIMVLTLENFQIG